MSSRATVMMVGGKPAFVAGPKGSAAVLTITGGEDHRKAKPNKHEEEKNKEWVSWGANDDFPVQIAKMIRKSTVARAGLQRLTNYMYGQRLITYKIKGITDGGKEEIEFVKNTEWEQIMSRTNFKMVRLGLKQDYVWWALCYAEFIMTEDKSKVYSVNFHKTAKCRLAPANEDGFIPYVYVSGNFPDVEAKDCQKIPVIDMINYHSQIEDIKADKGNHKYIMPMYWPDVINDYYPVAYWDSARESGYLDIAISIPAYKKAMFKNQMALKYDIKIPMSYFRERYTNWDKRTDEEKTTILQDLYDEILDRLTGAENAQKAILSFYDVDRNGKDLGKWEITPIDDKMKQGVFVPDSTNANHEITYAMGLNPAQGGLGNGGGTPSGGANNGGSNIRESGLDLRSQLRANRDICLSFFDFIKVYNGLDADLEIGVQDQVLTTIDEGKGTEKVVS